MAQDAKKTIVWYTTTLKLEKLGIHGVYVHSSIMDEGALVKTSPL